MHDFSEKDIGASQLKDDELNGVSEGARMPAPINDRVPKIAKYTCDICTKSYSGHKPEECACGSKSFSVSS